MELEALSYARRAPVALVTTPKPSALSSAGPSTMAHAESSRAPSSGRLGESNDREMEDSGTSSGWEAALVALGGLESFDDEGTPVATTEDYWMVDGTSGDEVTKEAQTIPSTTRISTSNAPASVSGLQKVSKSGQEDTMGLEGQPATRKKPRTLNADAASGSSRPVNSKTLDASGPSGDQNLSLGFIISDLRISFSILGKQQKEKT